MSETFTVPQEHGQDSTVIVTQGNVHTWRGWTNTLTFETDQSLKSQSGRAWNVREAIKRYCYERGYKIDAETAQSVTAVYDPRAHSHYAFGQVRDAIQSDPRYVEQMSRAGHQRSEIARQFGPPIAQLRNLIAALERKAHEAEKVIDETTAQVQADILSDLDLPAHLLDEERRYLGRPFDRSNVALGHHKGLPGDLDAILALLD